MPHSEYIVFVDESGDHSLTSIDSGYPVFVLCFCIFSKAHYSNQVVPKLKAIKFQTFGHDLVILHESDIRNKRGSFSLLNKELRDAFMDSLTTFMEEIDFTVISVIIDKEKYKEKYSLPEHPYHLALQFGLERIYSFLHQNGETEKSLHIVCESRGAKEDKELELAFRRVCGGMNRTNRSYPFNVLMADKRSNSEGLQIADLLARPIGLSVFKPEQLNRAYEVAKNKFYKGRHGFVGGNGKKIFP